MSRQQRCREPISVQSAKSATTRRKKEKQAHLRLSAFSPSNKPVSQSCTVAKSENFWWATGQSNLAYNWLVATSKIWFLYSHNYTLANGAVFHSVCQVWLSSGPPEFLTSSYCASLWNLVMAIIGYCINWTLLSLYSWKEETFFWLAILISCNTFVSVSKIIKY